MEEQKGPEIRRIIFSDESILNQGYIVLVENAIAGITKGNTLVLELYMTGVTNPANLVFDNLVRIKTGKKTVNMSYTIFANETQATAALETGHVTIAWKGGQERPYHFGGEFTIPKGYAGLFIGIAKELDLIQAIRPNEG